MKVAMKVFVVAMLFLALGTGTTVAQNGYDLFQQALTKERAEGNLEEAIQLYQRIVQDFAGDRALAAKALLQMGQCHEKLGRAEARKAYERVLREYADQAEQVGVARARLAALTQPASVTAASGMVVRRVWVPPAHMIHTGSRGEVCPDGRYLTFAGGRRPDHDDLFVRDLATGENRRLVQGGAHGGADESRMSPDCRQIAYQWDNSDDFDELRLIGIDGSGDRVLYRNEEVPHIHPREWLPDGKHIVVATTLKDRTSQIAVVSVADGSLRVLKSLDWGYTPRLTVSPDGRCVAYEFVPKQGSSQHDIALLAMDGSRETPLVTHPSDDDVIAWGPDGKTLLFVSNRTGRYSLWAIQVAEGKAHGVPQLIKKDIGRIRPWGFTRKGDFYYATTNRLQDVYVARLDPATGKILEPPRPATDRVVGSSLSPAWSSDGKHLAYYTRSGRSMVIRSLETGEERALSPNIRKSRYIGADMQWSPDGRFILRPGWIEREHGLYLVDTRTGGFTRVLRMPDGVYAGQAVWAPDGKSIYYSRRIFTPRNDTMAHKSSILRRELETSQETKLYEKVGGIAPNLAISPDGRHLAFVALSSDKGQTVLKIATTAGGEPVELARVHSEEVVSQSNMLEWTPDGRYLLYGKKGDDRGQLVELWRVAAEGGQPEKLDLAMQGLDEVRVHPDGSRIAFSAMREMDEIWAMENFLSELPAAR
ncbi:tetratricopeptide repeat protein [Acidobacteria bacterium AH-259-L09]|nr:tetratricopeptide repeat protein [Acidobacteria bacterium AH-259-L09]